MENRFEHSPPEEQGWGAYASPPKYGLRNTGLCADVRKMLPDLLENDGSVRPEMATAIHAHLAICRGCSRDYDQMQRVIARIEAMPPAELPMDFSSLIMQQILAQSGTERAVTVPQSRAQPPLSLSQSDQSVFDRKLASPISAAMSASAVTSVVAREMVSGQRSHSNSQVGAQLWQRCTVGTLLSAILAFFLNNAWGRQMLSVNVGTATSWLDQIGESMSRLPVLGGIAGLVFSALAQASGLLSETYHSLGSLAVRGLALDIAMGALAYYYVLTRRQRERRLGI